MNCSNCGKKIDSGSYCSDECRIEWKRKRREKYREDGFFRRAAKTRARRRYYQTDTRIYDDNRKLYFIMYYASKYYKWIFEQHPDDARATVHLVHAEVVRYRCVLTQTIARRTSKRFYELARELGYRKVNGKWRKEYTYLD